MSLPLSCATIASVLVLAALWGRMRRRLFVRPLMGFIRRRRLLPVISATERVAMQAGGSWFEGSLFAGRPDLAQLSALPVSALSAAEAAFVAGPTEDLCCLIDDWQIQTSGRIPDRVWDSIRAHRFFGLCIPREYGGHGFSHAAHSEVVHRIAMRSMAVGVVVMVPNSLGPAELLVRYGTAAQKARYLPALADGSHVPCFALTEPNAGSDAGALSAAGVVERASDGSLQLRLDWEKRYITMAPMATLIGLAFRLRDPQRLLGGSVDRGITIALVPADTPGVDRSRRHDPLAVPFPNGPIVGRDVVVPLECVIGGRDGIGQGWRMLMECLTTGRAVSLPAWSAAAAKLTARVTGAYTAVREQFGMSVGRFEGVQEPLARIASHAYVVEALRQVTCGGLDDGARSGVIGSIAKYWSTELARVCARDAMDVLGGAAISRGPRNLIAAIHVAAPIGITVEGANLLTRSLMIFGQGAVRSHRFAWAEIEALEQDDAIAFDRALRGHAWHLTGTVARVLWSGIGGRRCGRAPVKGPYAHAWRRIAWASARFALLAEIGMLTLGGTLKKRGALSGRYADALSWCCLLVCTLRRFAAAGQPDEHRPFVDLALQDGFHRIQTAFSGIVANLPLPGPVRWLAGALLHLQPCGRAPGDGLVRRAAEALQQQQAGRGTVFDDVDRPVAPGPALARLEAAAAARRLAEPASAAIRRAQRDGRVPCGADALRAAVDAGVIDAAAAIDVARAEELARAAIEVDAFPSEAPEAVAAPALGV